MTVEQERRYRKAPTAVMKRRARRVLVEWRAALVKARRDEDRLSAGEYTAITKRIDKRYDLWNEFGYLDVTRSRYISDLLKEVCKEAMRYILKGE